MQKNVRDKNKIFHLVLFIIFCALFFSFSVIITWDSSHYLSYVPIFEGASPLSSWDIVRGPIFPLIIFVSNVLFGKTAQGIMVCLFLFYVLYSTLCYYLCSKIFDYKKSKNEKRIGLVVFLFLIFNPIIYGYFHTLLTEFVAITITMISIVVSYKWYFIDAKSKKQKILFTLCFIAITLFSYHLKQPYIIIATAPMILSATYSLIKKHDRMEILYRCGTIFVTVTVLFVSIFAWGNFINSFAENADSGRDSSTMLSKQALTAAGIEYDKEAKQLSLAEAAKLLVSGFISNPVSVLGSYAANYCATSSICVITSNDGVNYSVTSQTDFINTFENRAIAYKTFSTDDNLFTLSNELHVLASPYDTAESFKAVSLGFKILRIPTNIIFKISIFLCPVFLAGAIILKRKYSKKINEKVFLVTLLCLGTALIHILACSVAGLIIDRYVVEVFAPIIIGASGIFMMILSIVEKRKKLSDNNYKVFQSSEQPAL